MSKKQKNPIARAVRTPALSRQGETHRTKVTTNRTHIVSVPRRPAPNTPGHRLRSQV